MRQFPEVDTARNRLGQKIWKKAYNPVSIGRVVEMYFHHRCPLPLLSSKLAETLTVRDDVTALDEYFFQIVYSGSFSKCCTELKGRKNHTGTRVRTKYSLAYSESNSSEVPRN